ncbi:MAG: acetyl-CoA carboxylase carboxyltransferase subunit alpha [Pyrinomonadaceae bacterium]
MENEQLTAMDRVKKARHPDRPYALDLFEGIFEEFVEVHGDRRYADDPALVCGFGRLDGMEVTLIGQQKGRDITQRRYRNFGMPKPEGYRKAIRVMKIAEKFSRPIITFVDTPGAYPGIDAEERGQAEAIAYNLREMMKLTVPTIVVVIGEGGSGGALAIGIGDRVFMMENAVYSVITPEGCAAILWKDAAQSDKAAEGLRLTASHLESLGIIDGIVSESDDWVFTEEGQELHPTTLELKNQLVKTLRELNAMDQKARLKERYDKFRRMGEWVTAESRAMTR